MTAFIAELPAQTLNPATPSRGGRLTVRPLGTAELCLWDRALEISPDDCAFYRGDFLNMLARRLDWPIVLIGCWDDGALVGGWAGMESRSERQASLRAIPMVPYGGFWTAGDPASSTGRSERSRSAVLAALGEHAAREYSAASIDLHPDSVDVRPLLWAGWSATVRYTYAHDSAALADPPVSTSVRRRARRAESEGVRIDPRPGAAELVRLWALSHRRQRQDIPAPEKELVRAVEDLMVRGACEIVGARLADGRLAAATCLIFDRRTAYYWLAGFDASEPHRGASNQLCHLHALRIAARRAERFDWVGANTPSIAHYKERFSPQLVPHYRVTWRGRPAPADSTARSPMMRWVRRHVPFWRA